MFGTRRKMERQKVRAQSGDMGKKRPLDSMKGNGKEIYVTNLWLVYFIIPLIDCFITMCRWFLVLRFAKISESMSCQLQLTVKHNKGVLRDLLAAKDIVLYSLVVHQELDS